VLLTRIYRLRFAIESSCSFSVFCSITGHLSRAQYRGSCHTMAQSSPSLEAFSKAVEAIYYCALNPLAAVVPVCT
jgi:hypothetical protein